MSTRSLSAKVLLALLAIVFLGQDTQAQVVNWRTSLDAAKVEASRTGKLVLLHFYTSSCGPCKKLDRDVFSQPQIAVALERDYIPIKINADDSPALANAFQITRVPSEVVLTSQGNIVQKLSCPLEPDAYGAQLANVAQHYHQRTNNRTESVQTPVNSAYAGLKISGYNNASTTTAAMSANHAPLPPAVTTNPYVFAAPPTVQQQPKVATVVPANAMPNSYRNRYAATTPQAPAVRPTPVTPAPVTPTVTPVVVAVPPAAAAPPIAKTTAPPDMPMSPTTGQVAVAAQADAPQEVVETWPPQLPPNTPELAFDGYCPVSLQREQKWVRGKKTFGAIHRGRTYLFASEPLRQKFLAAPDAYSPVFSGNDPVKMLDENQVIAGSRSFGFEYDGAFYLFAGKESMERFARQRDRYATEVRQAMNRMDAAGAGTIRR